MVHIDSAVAIFAALRNPALKLHRIDALFPPGVAITSGPPQRFSVKNPFGVLVRTEPSEATAALDFRGHRDVVVTTGKSFDLWVEVAGGGWVLTDSSGIGTGTRNLELVCE